MHMYSRFCHNLTLYMALATIQSSYKANSVLLYTIAYASASQSYINVSLRYNRAGHIILRRCLCLVFVTVSMLEIECM